MLSHCVLGSGAALKFYTVLYVPDTDIGRATIELYSHEKTTMV